jgi:hypothetical protein
MIKLTTFGISILYLELTNERCSTYNNHGHVFNFFFRVRFLSTCDEV